MRNDKDRALGLSGNIREIEPSVTLAVSAEAQRLKAAGEDIINLSS